MTPVLRRPRPRQRDLGRRLARRAGVQVLLSNGQVYSYGDATADGSPPATDFNIFDTATSIFSASDGAGYWVSSALGAVYNFGDAPNDGGMSATHLNGSIIAATGF